MSNEIKILEQGEVVVGINYNEAAELTEAIKSTASALHILIRRAHDTRAWAALGYDSWKSYVEGEFEFSRSRAYQLIDQSKVIEEISTAAGVDLYITEKDARVIKKRLPEITQKISDETSDLDKEEAHKKAQDIINSELYAEEVDMVSTNQKDVNYSFEEEDEEVMVGSHIPSGQEPHKEVSGEDKFYLENLDRTLSIFEAMPGPSEMSKVIKGHKDLKEIKDKAEFAYSWLLRLFDELES